MYVCESIFDEAKRQIRSLPPTGLKKYQHSSLVQTDEIYFFPQPLTPEKESLTKPELVRPTESSPMLDVNEDSMDAPSVGSLDSVPPTPMMLGAVNTMTTASPSPALLPKKKEEKRKKLVTAYILFSMDQRRIPIKKRRYVPCLQPSPSIFGIYHPCLIKT